MITKIIQLPATSVLYGGNEKTSTFVGDISDWNLYELKDF